MAKFLRDRQVRNLSITTARIRELFGLCFAYADRLVAEGLPANEIQVRCIIRFDQKGYTVFTLAEVLRYYEEAKEVERLIFTVETRESIDTNRARGAFMELMLDKKNVNGFLTVTADNQRWVDDTFSAFHEVVLKSAAWYGRLRSVWIELIVQVAGAAGVFLLSLIVAKRLAPNLAVENAFLIAFLFAFLLAANIWGFLQRQVHSAIESVFANVQFVRAGKEQMHWVFQACVSAVVGVGITYILGFTGMTLLGATTSLFTE